MLQRGLSYSAQCTGDRHVQWHRVHAAPTARRRLACQCSLYNFAETKPRTDTGASRNRGREKKEASLQHVADHNPTSRPTTAQQLLDLVRGLVSMNRKQLAAVSHLLNDEQLEHLRLAARLPITNQGRKREENLVAKLLRAEEDEATLEKLAVAVKLAEDANVYMDEDAEELLTQWREGLLADDQAVVQEVFSLAETNALDTQRLRQLVLQCRQAAQQKAEEVAAVAQNAAASTSAEDGTESNAGSSFSDPELEEVMQSLPSGKKVKAQGTAASAGSVVNGGKHRRGSLSAERRAISKMLRPLSLQAARHRAADAQTEAPAG